MNILEKEYRYIVEMEGREPFRVNAPDKNAATHRAAAAWGVKWRETVRDMTVHQIGRAPVKGRGA